jgi:TPR repeat protein
MSLLSRFAFNRHRAHEAELEAKVTALQAVLDKCKGMACDCARLWREMMVGGIVVTLAVGYVLGVYNAPIRQLIADLAGPLGLASPVQNADAAYAAFQKGDYTAALELARPLAETGDAKAQSILGLMNYRGRGVSKDDHDAMKWFRRAADQGDASARAYLGVMFAEGRGVPKDSEEAAKWYRLAADQGDPMAQYNLGLAYATGEGVEQDSVSAHMWFNLAAARFPASAARSRSDAVKNREVVAGKMTPEQLAEAQKLAREWRPK